MFQSRGSYLSHLADIRKEVIHNAPTMARLRSPVRLPVNHEIKSLLHTFGEALLADA